ncbi:Wzy polymerase domain-containing protein [Parasalinivibrio latis]|uniref:PglL family O-oligosaccharyltransferase n=1 Tax=Parasalinivibrio latis TaxID=2952610 RepID=UPI0030E4F54B
MINALTFSSPLTQIRRKPLTKPFIAALCVLFLAATHYFQHNPGGAGLVLSFNAMAWIPFGLALALGVAEICRQHTLRYTRLTQVLFISCILLTIPLFYPDAEPLLAAQRILGLWLGLLFFVCLQQFAFSHPQRQFLLWLVLVAVWIEAVFGWTQFLWLEPGNAIGYDTEVNRPYGIFQQPNVMASFLATGLVLSAYLLARTAMYRGKWNWQQVILLLTPPLTIPLLVVIASRTGWLGAAVGVVLILPYLRKFAPKAPRRLWFLMVLLGLAAGNYFLQSVNTDLIEHKTSLETARSATIPQTWELFTERPFAGWGYGRFEPTYMVETAKQYHAGLTDKPPLASMDHPHNELLYWAVEGGIVPLAGLLLAATVVLLNVMEARSGTKLALVALFLPITLHSQLEYPFYHSLVHWLVFILLIYWVDNLTAKYERRAIKYTLGLKLFALTLPLAVAYVSITTLYSGAMLTKYETTKPNNPDYLSKVNNTWVWRDRLDWDIYTTQLELGIKRNRPDLIESYIKWAENKAVLWPRAALYQNLILAWRHLGNEARAEQIREEAEFIFPGKRFAASKALPAVTAPEA